MVSQIRGDVLLKGIISIFIAAVITYIPNYQYFLYQMQDAVSKQEVEDSSMYYYIGYPAGDDITEVNSVKEIEENKYFTIVIEKEKLKATDYYMIIDRSEAGIHHSSGRYSYDWYVPNYLNGKFSAMVSNYIYGAYAQFYVAELNSGEKVMVFLDHMLLPTMNKKTIHLPIGKTRPHYFLQEKYDVDKENIMWFVDMTGTYWYHSKPAKLLRYFRFILTIVIIVINYRILIKIFKKYKVFEK